MPTPPHRRLAAWRLDPTASTGTPPCGVTYTDVVTVRILRVEDGDPEYRRDETTFKCERDAGHGGDHQGHAVPDHFGDTAIWRP